MLSGITLLWMPSSLITPYRYPYQRSGNAANATRIITDLTCSIMFSSVVNIEIMLPLKTMKEITTVEITTKETKSVAE